MSALPISDDQLVRLEIQGGDRHHAAFSSDEWNLIQEACEQRCRQWQHQVRHNIQPAQQDVCVRRASALAEIIARIRELRKIAL